MIKIAVSLPPEARLALMLMRQCGVEHAVCHTEVRPIPGASEDEQPWSVSSLAKVKAAYEASGFELSVYEGRPPMEKIKLNLPGRDEEIDVV